MTRQDARDRDLVRLMSVHPELRRRIGQVFAAMQALGFEMVVTDALRTDAEQIALFAQGRTTPGDRVTNADGVIKRSNHQVKADGWGHAVDCAFLIQTSGADHWAPSWDDKKPWGAYGAAGEAVGLVWGGRFTTLKGGDRPHLELA